MALRDYKRGKFKHLVCTHRTARVQAIESRLQQKKAVRCTCKGGQHSMTNEKCQLHPRTAGDKRWPGCNLKDEDAVTEADWKFCQRMRERKRQKTRLA